MKNNSRCGAWASSRGESDAVEEAESLFMLAVSGRREFVALIQVRPRTRGRIQRETSGTRPEASGAHPCVGVTLQCSGAFTPSSSAAGRGATHSRNTNQAIAIAPTLKIVSPGTRIQISMSTMGCCMNSAERA